MRLAAMLARQNPHPTSGHQSGGFDFMSATRGQQGHSGEAFPFSHGASLGGMCQESGRLLRIARHTYAMEELGEPATQALFTPTSLGHGSKASRQSDMAWRSLRAGFLSRFGATICLLSRLFVPLSAHHHRLVYMPRCLAA